MEKLPVTSSPDHRSANRGKARPPICRRGIPHAVLDDADLLIGIPSGARRAFAAPVFRSGPDFLTPQHEIVRREHMAGHAALSSGGIIFDRVRDDLLELAHASDGTALEVAKWLIRRRLVCAVVATAMPNSGAEVGGSHD